MNTTESNIICTGCDAPFLPTTGDLCPRCEQRSADRMGGVKLGAWVVASAILILSAIASKCHGSCVDDALLNRVAWAESRNNPRAVGKLGEIGMFQLRPIAIREVNRVNGMCFRLQDAKDPVKSREIARLYLLICESRCRVKTQASVYAKYRGMK